METKAQYFDCLCRTCMNNVEASSHDGTTIPQKQWLSISDIIEECGALRIAELLSDAVPQIVVQPSDELPKKICTECLQQLLSVYRFQQMCVKSDKQMHELLSKEKTVLKTPMLEGAIKGETETNDADSQPLKELRCSSTLHNLQQPSIQEPLPKVTDQTIELEAAQSSAEHLQDNTQLLEYCNNSQGEFEEFIKNEPIEDDEGANSEYSDGNTMHSTISVAKEEVLPIGFEDQQVNDASSRHNCHLCNKSYKRRDYLRRHLSNHKKKANNSEEYCFACHLCSESYKEQRYLKMHLNLKHSIELRYTCDSCNKSYASSYELSRHILTHTGEQPYVSPECGKSFTAQSSSRHNCHLCNKSYKRREYLTRHLCNHKRKANNSQEYCFACHLCSESYKKQRYLRMHLNLKHSIELRYTCDVCNKSYASSYELRRHVRTHTGERPNVSPECGKSFSAQSVLGEQRTTHARDKPYECPYCPLRFSLKINASTHKTIHEGIRPHKCGICGKKFRLKSALKRHKQIHSNEKPHKCDQCEKRFFQRQELQLHIRTHTGEKPYKCKYCERGFSAHCKLNYHLRSHLGENIHRCKFCPLAFSLKSEMLVHLTSHKNEDPEVRERNLKALQEVEAKLVLKFSKEKSKGPSTEEQQQQKLCNKEIEQPSSDLKSSVATHKIMHEEIKRHKCSICGKKFRQKSDLIRHKRIHSKEKPHKCDICDKRFTHMQPLETHMRTHTGEKPNKCKYCERGFASHSLLNYHLSSHLGENIHRCKFCPLAFPSSAERRIHLTSHKNEDPEVRERNLKALQEEEAKLVLKFSKEKGKGESTEEQQQHKLSNKEIDQQSTDILAVQRPTHADKPYECPYCPRKFNSNGSASRHKAVVHEGAAKQYECDICGTKWWHQSALKTHKLTHSKEKRYKCDFCEKRCTHKAQLQVHIRTHTGEKPIKCKYCERGFTCYSRLNYHLRRHLGNNIHRCKFCPLAFPSSVEMRLHLTLHKNEDPEVREQNLKALQDEEAKLVLKFSKEKSKGQSTEEQQQQKLPDKDIEQPSTDRDEFEDFIKNEPIDDDKFNSEYSDEDTILSTISVTKDEALPIESDD